MTKREQNPTGRKLKVRWSTKEWTPTIRVMPEQNRSAAQKLQALEVVLDPFVFGRRKPRKRKAEAELWLRAGGRMSNRSTWR
jgi:hypothetical protein